MKPPKKKTIKYLDVNFRQSIEKDIVKISKLHSIYDGGFYSIPRSVFCCIDYLGYIAFGYLKQNNEINHTRCSVDFIKNFFPKSYRNYAELLYSMWRHGTVHNYEPDSFYVYDPNNKPKKISVKWLANNDNTISHRKGNLKFYPMERRKGSIWLTLNICKLADDLLYALDKLIKKMDKEHEFKKKCEKRLNEFGKIKNYDLLGRSIRDKVKNQVLLAWKKRETTRINAKGETIK